MKKLNRKSANPPPFSGRPAPAPYFHPFFNSSGCGGVGNQNLLPPLFFNKSGGGGIRTMKKTKYAKFSKNETFLLPVFMSEGKKCSFFRKLACFFFLVFSFFLITEVLETNIWVTRNVDYIFFNLIKIMLSIGKLIHIASFNNQEKF